MVREGSASVDITLRTSIRLSDEAFTAALKENTAWKPYATEENQKKLADAWAETLRRMQKDQDQLNELKAVAARIVNAPALVTADIGAVADF